MHHKNIKVYRDGEKSELFNSPDFKDQPCCILYLNPMLNFVVTDFNLHLFYWMHC